MSNFTDEEKRKYKLKYHIKSHLFEYILDIVGPVLLTILILYLCKAENYIIGIIVAFIYSVIKVILNIHNYKKEYININYNK